jgi:hypothetical protein
MIYHGYQDGTLHIYSQSNIAIITISKVATLTRCRSRRKPEMQVSSRLPGQANDRYPVFQSPYDTYQKEKGRI